LLKKILGFSEPTLNLKRLSRIIGEKLLKYSHEYGFVDETRVELQRILQTLDPSIGSRITNLHGRILEQQQPHQAQGDEEIFIQQPTEESSNFEPNREKRGGEWDHLGRKGVKTIQCTTEKVKKILQIHTAVMQEQITAPKMTEACRSFFKDCVGPIANCLTLHFNGNITTFLEHHTKSGKLLFSKFAKICCGKRMSCASNYSN
jgi:hypothetical protein